MAVAEDGGFHLLATPGLWRLEWHLDDGTVRTRSVTVEQVPVVVSGAFDGAPGAPTASGREPRVADFDALTTSDTVIEIPEGYAGLRWTNWVAIHQKRTGAPGFLNTTTSGEYVAYNSSGHPATVHADQPFDLEGAHLGIGHEGGQAHEVVVRAWRGDQLVHVDRVRAGIGGPVWFAAGYRAVTRVEFASSAYWQVVVDDLAYRPR